MVNLIDQIWTAILDALATAGAFLKPLEAVGLDNKLQIIIAAVTAMATIILATLTWALARETARMRRASDRAAEVSARTNELTERIHEWNVQAYDEAKEPRFVIYTEIDDVERTEAVIFENITDNPAFDVSIKFRPDAELKVFHESVRPNPTLSDLGFGPFAVIAPHQKLRRSFTVVSDGSGDFTDDFTKLDIDVEVSYRTYSRELRTVHLTLDRSHSKQWSIFPRDNLIALQEQMKKSFGDLSRTVRHAADLQRTPVRQKREIPSVVKGTRPPPQIPRPVRDRLPTRRKARS